MLGPNGAGKTTLMRAILGLTVEGGTLDLFVSLMRKRARFHPVEVLVEPDGRFVIGDGHHRTDCEPAMRLHPSADLAVRIAGA